MNHQHHNRHTEIWQRLVSSFPSAQHFSTVFDDALNDFLQLEHGRIEVMQMSLGRPGIDRQVSLTIFEQLSLQERQSLFPELVELASFSHGAIQKVRDLIIALPKTWVIDRIEGISEPLLTQGAYDEYRRFLELYSLIDIDLAVKLAHMALLHSDEDVREVGRDFFDAIDKSTKTV